MKAINVNSISVRIRRNLLIKFARFFPDRTFLELLFPLRTGYTLDLENPQTYNEKLQWLKLYNRKPDYIQMVDKVEAKKYAASIIGEEHIIPTLAVYDRAEDIDFDMFPQQFVLKCTHDSGGIVICSDKDRLDKAAAIKKLKKGLKKNYYFRNREWPYKNVKPRIIAEKYMTDDGHELKDYKFFCFNGEPKFVQIDFDRYSNHRRNVYDINWNLLDLQIKFPKGHDRVFPKPENYDEMVEISRKLSKGIPHVRIDLYNVKGKIYFGEITFFHGSGMEVFTPLEWDYKFGEFIHINTK